MSPTASRLLSAGLLGALALLPSCRGRSGSAAARAARVAFATRQEIATSLRALRSVASADFTGNGLVDLVVSSLVDREVRVLVAGSAGSWSTAAGFRAAYSDVPGELACGDLDADGDVDFACLFEESGIVRAYRNDGAGRFAEDPQPLVVGARGAGLVIADAGGSKSADVIVCGDGGGNVLVFLAVASGFAQPIRLPAGVGAELSDAWAGDLNGDGRPDVAVTDVARDRVVVFYQESGGFNSARRQLVATGAKGPLSLVGDELTGDGLVDLAVANFGSGTLVVLPGTGAGSFLQPIPVRLDGNPVHVDSGDVFEDGRNHVVVSYLDRASIGVIPAFAEAGFGPERQYGTSGLPTMCEVVDLDGDGFEDIVTSGLDSTFLSWLRGNGLPGPLGSENFAPGGPSPEFTISEDYDGDGNADALVSDRTAGVCTILRGRGRPPSGELVVTGDIGVGTQPHALGRGDFDHDGRVDAAVAVAGGLRFLLNRSTPAGIAFELQPPLSEKPFASGVGPFEVVAGRFDSDDLDDLAVADFGGDQVLLFRASGPGFGFVTPGAAVPVSGNPLAIIGGDFDRDGNQDVAVSRFTAEQVSVLRGNGRGGLLRWRDLPAGSAPNYLRSADFDGNGVADLVVSNLGGDRLTVFLARGQEFTSFDVQVGEAPTALLARDLDFDGNADVLVANAGSADFHVLIGDGGGGFSSAIRFPGTFRAISADLGDVDGDTLPDLLVTSLFTNRISLYRNLSK